MKKTADRMKKLRKNKSYSQLYVGKRVGADSSTISGYELGKISPSIEVVIQYTKLFGVSADYILGIDNKLNISLEGLKEEQVEVITNLIQVMREGNQ